MAEKVIIEALPLAGQPIENQQSAIEDLNRARQRIAEEVGKIIIGQHQVIAHILTAAPGTFANGANLQVQDIARELGTLPA